MPKFQLDQVVTIGTDGGSTLTGTVKGITTYAESEGCPPRYYVKFKHPVSGLPATEWFDESDLAAF